MISVSNGDPPNRASAKISGSGPLFWNVMQIRASRLSSPSNPAAPEATEEKADPTTIWMAAASGISSSVLIGRPLFPLLAMVAATLQKRKAGWKTL